MRLCITLNTFSSVLSSRVSRTPSIQSLLSIHNIKLTYFCVTFRYRIKSSLNITSLYCCINSKVLRNEFTIECIRCFTEVWINSEFECKEISNNHNCSLLRYANSIWNTFLLFRVYIILKCVWIRTEFIIDFENGRKLEVYSMLYLLFHVTLMSQWR